MPGGDMTGPSGEGPLTGGGRGRCVVRDDEGSPMRRGFFGFGSGRRGRGRGRGRGNGWRFWKNNNVGNYENGYRSGYSEGQGGYDDGYEAGYNAARRQKEKE